MKHGGDLTDAMTRYGGTSDMWLDLSTGVNPSPWPIPADLPDVVWQRLPSRAAEDELIAAARDAYAVPDDAAIVAAPGTQALIQWLPQLATAGSVAIVGPTYHEHELAWRTAGHALIAIDNLDAIPDDANHVVVVNPNNPDGRVTPQAALVRAAKVLRERGGWMVVDEAFADVKPDISAVGLCADWPVIILRSFGKFYGLAGLRLGFAITSPGTAQRISQALGPWACSGPALNIGAIALRDHAWAKSIRSALQHKARELDIVLADAGFRLHGGTSLFRLAQHPRATDIHAALATEHIWCRRFEWAGDLLRFGLPSNEGDLERLARALVSAT